MTHVVQSNARLSNAHESTGDAAVIRDLAHEAAARQLIEVIPGEQAVLVLEAGQHVHDVDLAEFAPHPRRMTGNAALTDPDAFIDYVRRYSSQALTTVWSNVDKGTVTAVLNDHGNDLEPTPGHADHRGTLTLKNSPDWDHWMKADGKLMPQTEFAVHIEDATNTIVEPDAATMLELAQTFHANTKVDFKSGQQLSSGETQLKYEETTAATAGKTGTISIPTYLRIRTQVFQGGPEYELRARFVYRIIDGKLLLGYRLIRPDQARDLAFDAISTSISEGVGLNVYPGTR